MLGTDVVTQIAVVVHDIDAASEAYASLLGVAKPEAKLTDAYEDSRAEYRGEPTGARATLAFFQVGPQLSIELIEPDDQPSTWREHLDQHGEGVHPIAFRVEDMDETVSRLGAAGMPLVQSGHFPGGRYAYVDSCDALKVTLELLARA